METIEEEATPEDTCPQAEEQHEHIEKNIEKSNEPEEVSN